jgi:hypothetical protein
MLFKTLSEIQNHLVVGNGTDFNRVKPHISNAETAYIQPLLGTSLFTQLQGYYENTDPPEGGSGSGSGDINREAMAVLLTKVQKSLIHLAYWMGFQVLNATISDGGFKRTESTTSKSLFHYQEDELKEYFKTAGFNAMDEVLEYLELNIDDFDDFDMSPTWTIFKSAFIPDTKTFGSIYFINNSRLTFLRLKSYCGLIEDMEIRPILGTAIFDEVKAEMIEDAPAAKVLAILSYIRKPIAYLATAMLMEESGADLTEKGLYFESTSATTISGKNKQPSNAERIAQLTARNQGLGNAYLDQLKSYLAANATDWPTYSGQTGSVFRRDNTDKKTFWA